MGIPVGTKPAHPPGWCVSAVHARASWKGIRHLEALVDYPVLKPDGTILDTPGYDEETGLYLVTRRSELPTVPDEPTRRDAQDALRLLLEVVCDFPFASRPHRSAWVAALLTPLARFAFAGVAPLFLVDANIRAAGKGLLLHCVSTIISGDRFTVATYTEDQDELRKRITSIALGGDRMVLFDNLTGVFGGHAIDAALTSTAWSDRILGVNKMADVPLYVTWYATGNNVAVAGDMSRRTCHIRLESDREDPELRDDFRHPDLLRYVRQNRVKLLGAALTVLRAYFVAGRPDMNLPAWGSFEGWSDTVRSALVWAGLADPGLTRQELKAEADVGVGSMAVLLSYWSEMDPNNEGITAAEICRLLDPRTDTMRPPQWKTEAFAAVEALCGKLDPGKLGAVLRTYRRRIINDKYLDHQPKSDRSHKVARWFLRPAEEFDRAT
jgi:hypothetical protein